MFLIGSPVPADIGLMLVFGFALGCVSGLGFYVVRAELRQRQDESLHESYPDEDDARTHGDHGLAA
jgi:hypothetical protein